MLPVMWLPPISKFIILVLFPNSEGIEHEKWFILRFINVRSVKFANEEGMEPDKKLLEISSSLKWIRFSNSVGIGPEI
ncbi:hypothetical protein QJS10_CPB18g02041 [Acorus calamus]|uniref:Uncharacterized protein n=1 Tax=Acorus calamus TaxID=4465 RepID=A0AAV9CQS6_ACOCL|nr:hypothetical protein QJS10_CPB18g02041 [Acorus calamus]